MGRGLGVINCFDSLRHDAVVRCNDQHDDVGHVSAARTHRGESRMTRCIDKRDLCSIVLNTVSANVLRDSASFTGCDPRLTNRIHKRGFAMIDMSHERNDGSARLEFFFLFNNGRRGRHNNLFDLVNAAAFLTTFFFQNESVVLGNFRRDIRLDGLVDIREDVECHQLRDELMRF